MINALMLLLTSWASNRLELDFHVVDFGAALFGSLIISLVAWGLHLALDDD
ncbi:phage holin family protein [Streptomyces althioticus]|uniref:phage holin family protein n=1 Tax=Streptomyces althioticus TaxID=83380 RepID=UPI0036F5252D